MNQTIELANYTTSNRLVARTWNNIEDRQSAALDFAAEMETDRVLRTNCKKDSNLARRTFARVGGMTDIPADVVFRVFEEDDAARDKLVVLILPELDTPMGDIPLHDVLNCTRPPRPISD